MKRMMMVFIPATLLMAVISVYWMQVENTDIEPRTGNTANVASVTFYDANPFKVRAVLKPEVPKAGKNHVTIFVQDKTGKPVSGATLKVVAVMPSMGSMPAMYAPAAMKESAAGKYEGEFTPAMSGSWPLTIDINAKGNKGSITFDLATGRKGLRCTTCEEQVTAIPGTIRVNPDRRQLIGVTTGKVKQKNLQVTIRAAGTIAYDETQLSDVSMKFNGWIGDIYADSIGKPVTKSDVLFTVYSPELLATQSEYLEALRRVRAKGGNRKGLLLEAARRRLSLWGMTPAQIKTLARRGKAQDYVPILAPASGVVIEKQIVAGSAFKAGQLLLHIANLSRVWVEAQVYDYEIPLINTGMKASVTLPDIQDRKFEGKVDYIYPFMESDTRTARVRVVLDNADGFLRPDMYAQVKLRVNMGNRLLVPESAVLYAGEARVVFLDIGDGRLQPRKIKTGQRNRRWIEVISGLKAGDTVVTSGNFLIAAESKLKSGLSQW